MATKITTQICFNAKYSHTHWNLTITRSKKILSKPILNQKFQLGANYIQLQANEKY